MPPQSSVDLRCLLSATFLAGAEQHENIPSTNDLARELPADARLPHLILAADQTAGRGRGDNIWWTGRGSLAMSLVIDPAAHGIPSQHVLLVSLACGVALVETARAFAAGIPLGLHWPNDVFAADRKLSGILIEGLPGGWMVIGIGVNTNNTLADAPPELRAIATTLRDLTGRQCDQTEFLIGLLARLKNGLSQLAEHASAVARQANDLCLQHGQKLTVATGQSSRDAPCAVTGQSPTAKSLVVGICRGIDDDGALILATAAGLKRIYSGALVKQLPPTEAADVGHVSCVPKGRSGT